MAMDEKLKAGDLMKRVLTVGIGAIFLTEESLRSLVSDFKLPKELMSGVLESANKTKREFFSRLSSDVLDRIMTKVNPDDLIREILTKNEIEFKVSVNLKPKVEGESYSDVEGASETAEDSQV